jgi:hypothetical protein
VKFVLPRELAHEVRAWSRERLPADPHGGGLAADTYTITTLYFDTPSLQVRSHTAARNIESADMGQARRFFWNGN